MSAKPSAGIIDVFINSDNEENKKLNERRKIYKPTAGRIWNPLNDYPPNRFCFCGKRKKAKLCCLPKMHASVPEKMGRKLQSYMEAVKQEIEAGR